MDAKSKLIWSGKMGVSWVKLKSLYEDTRPGPNNWSSISCLEKSSYSPWIWFIAVKNFGSLQRDIVPSESVKKTFRILWLKTGSEGQIG